MTQATYNVMLDCPICGHQDSVPVHTTLAGIQECPATCGHGTFVHDARRVADPVTHRYTERAEWLWWDRDDATLWDLIRLHRNREPQVQEYVAPEHSPELTLGCLCGAVVTATANVDLWRHEQRLEWEWTCAACQASGTVQAPGESEGARPVIDWQSVGYATYAQAHEHWESALRLFGPVSGPRPLVEAPAQPGPRGGGISGLAPRPAGRARGPVVR